MLLKNLIECLNEELNQELKSILDSDIDVKFKHNLVTKKIRKLISNGEDTGLDNDKPKLGSSRAVYFPKNETEIHIDGEKTTIPTAVKIAFPSKLDKYRPKKPLFGEMQNYAENEPILNKMYSVLHKINDSHFEHNTDGILAPIINTHEDHHWLEMGKVHDLDAASLKKMTISDEFPKGITHSAMKDAIVNYHLQSIGRRTGYDGTEKIYKHPLVNKLISYMCDSDVSPHEFDARNMGIWQHPITKTKHIVLRDFGATHDMMKEYANVRALIKKRNDNDYYKLYF